MERGFGPVETGAIEADREAPSVREPDSLPEGRLTAAPEPTVGDPRPETATPPLELINHPQPEAPVDTSAQLGITSEQIGGELQNPAALQGLEAQVYNGMTERMTSDIS